MIIFLFFLASSIANAQTGDLQFINSVSFTDGSAFGSANVRENYYSFMEYGYSKKISFGGFLNGVRTDSMYNNGTVRYSIVGPELFYRYKFFAKGRNGMVLHNAIKFPGFYDENKNLGLMPRQWDYEVRLLLLHNFKERLVNSIVHSTTPYFIRSEIAYRQRFNNPFNEVRFVFLGGFNFTNKFGVLIQDNISWNIMNDGYANNPLNNTYDNFNITKDANNLLTTSLIYHCNKHMALQFGYIRRIHGNNPFYDNGGIVIGVWNALK